MDLAVSKTKTTEVTAIIYPQCMCGKHIAEHLAPDCAYYRPSRPLESVGTVAFQSPDLIATLYWKIERFFNKLRKNRLRR